MWVDTATVVPNFNFDESTHSLKVDINPNASPQAVFELLFMENIMQYVVDCTNNYGAALTTTNRPKTKNSRDAYFPPVSLDEMKKFFALCLLQGQISTSNMRRFFSYADILYVHPLFSYVMSGRRFEQILRVLYCSTTLSKKKEKGQPFLDMLIDQFQSIYSPPKELSLDESLLHFRSRLGFRVYNKNKKSKYGIKFYELTTSEGYLLNTEMYTGAVENKEQDSTNNKLEPLVLRLMKPYLMKGHKLYMDNFYNSYRLFEKLLALRTHSCGTLRSNRIGNPCELVNKKVKKGDHIWARRNQVYVSKWRDKRDVLIITTRDHPRLEPTTNRYAKELIKPIEIVAYNRHMSGINRCDQMISTYSTPRKPTVV
ncbi:Transposase IS4 [Popillia japonica]|uniref:Transposase IS4 n=1 Tax=Popillia japonica TaxID=7064 RepID=A0AAW1MH10_POPJA